MEGNSAMGPEITIDPAAIGGAVREVKQRAIKEPTTPGMPSQATVYCGGGDGGKSAGYEGAAAQALPWWKLDCLCRESGLPPAMKGGFLCF